jgi:hypothetical protein
MKKSNLGFAGQFTGKRIESLDILRGFAIISIVVLHRLHYNWAAAGPGRDIGEGVSKWVLYLLFYLITMAGIFSLITGTVNAFKAYQRNAEGRNSTRQLLYGGLSTGLWILVLHYIQRIFFANGFTEGRFPVGVLLGWMRTGQSTPVSPNLYTESNALSMIGLVIIILTLVMVAMFRNGKPRNLKKDTRLFIILGFLILATTPFVRYGLGLYKTVMIQDQNYFAVTLINLLIGGYGMFPFLSYGFFGAAIGAYIAGGVSKIQLKKYLLIFGMLFFLIGGVGFFILGGWGFNNLFQNTMPNQLHWILFRMNQLGFFLFLYWVLLSAVDFATGPSKERILRFFYPARVFGMVSLTVFFCEPILAEILRKAWDMVFPGWTEQLVPVVIFGLFCLMIWWFILMIWYRTVKFAGSLEWLGASVVRMISGKKTSKLNYKF